MASRRKAKPKLTINNKVVEASGAASISRENQSETALLPGNSRHLSDIIGSVYPRQNRSHPDARLVNLPKGALVKDTCRALDAGGAGAGAAPTRPRQQRQTRT